MIRSVLTGFEPVTSRTWLNPGPQLWQTSRIRNRKKLKLIWLKKRKSSFFHIKSFFLFPFSGFKTIWRKKKERKGVVTRNLWSEKRRRSETKNKFRSKKKGFEFEFFFIPDEERTPVRERAGSAGEEDWRQQISFWEKKNRGVSQLLFFLLSDDDLNFSYKKQPGGRIFFEKKENCEKVWFVPFAHALPPFSRNLFEDPESVHLKIVTLDSDKFFLILFWWREEAEGKKDLRERILDRRRRRRHRRRRQTTFLKRLKVFESEMKNK